MGGSPLFGLDVNGGCRRPAPRLLRDSFSLDSHDDRDTPYPGFANQRQDMTEHRPASDLVQHFRPVGFHPRSFAGR